MVRHIGLRRIGKELFTDAGWTIKDGKVAKMSADGWFLGWGATKLSRPEDSTWGRGFGT